MKDAKVLLIEDDDVDAMNVERAFKEIWPNAAILRAKNGEQALILLERTLPTIVILDLSMPGLHGFEVLSEIKSNEGFLGVPVIVCSGSDAPEDIKKSYANKANAYAVKPNSVDGYREFVTSIKKFWGESATITPAYLV